MKVHFKHLFFLLFIIGTQTNFAQTALVKYGQSRVQYKDFDFQYYKTDKFVTYFYPGGQDIGKYVVKTCEDQANELSQWLDVKYHNRIDVIVFNTIADLNQSNIGIYSTETNTDGSLQLSGNKLFVYFNGSHADLQRQIREGLGKLYVEKLMSGGSFTQRLSNSLFLNLSDWYKKGLIKYIGESWNADLENKLRDGIMSEQFKNLHKLSLEDQVFVGHSLWHYIEETYGRQSINTVLYVTRTNRSIENGFQYGLGISLEDLMNNWYKYYVSRYNSEVKSAFPPNPEKMVQRKTKKETTYYQSRMSPDGKWVAYSTNNWGRIKVHLLNVDNHHCKTIFRAGWRTKTLWTDESTPLLAWSPKGENLSILYDKKAIVRLATYQLDKKKWDKRRIEKFAKVYSLNYGADAKNLLFSAFQKGQSDIFQYTIASQTVRQITDDYFDDFEPAYTEVAGMRGVLFASNRTDDTLRKKHYNSEELDAQTDIYFYPLDGGENALYRITNTPQISEKSPASFNSQYYSFLSEANGIRNVHIGKLETRFAYNQKKYVFRNEEANELDSVYLEEKIIFDSVYDPTIYKVLNTSSEPVYKTTGSNHQFTNFASNIREGNFSFRKKEALYQFLKKGKVNFYTYSLDTNKIQIRTDLILTAYTQKLTAKKFAIDSASSKKEITEVATPQVIPDSTAPIVPAADSVKSVYGRDFQSEFDVVNLVDIDSASVALIQQEEVNALANYTPGYIFKASKVRPYFVRFAVDKSVGQINNDLLFTRYQPFNRDNPTFTYQPLNALFKVGISDLMEDYKIYGGITLPLAGSAGFSVKDLGYFLVYENLKKRLDKKLTFFRQSNSKIATDKIPFTNQLIKDPNSPVYYSIKTTYLELAVNYPFDVIHSIRGTLAYRNDNYVYKATDSFTMNLPNYSMNWIYLRGEYVFDNSINVQQNIRHGSRIKFFAEFHKEIPTKQYHAGDATFTLPSFNKYYFTEIGVDARHYFKLYKSIILATRLAFGTSLGNRRMIHYLGGLDNSLLTIKNNSSAGAYINPATDYAFQTVVAPLRGFIQNTRNGTSYALLNAELRVPIFAALMHTMPKSEFVKNFALVAFVDAGTAWDGANPFSEKNPLFIEKYDNPVSTIRVQKFKSPIVMGLGSGLRTSLLGYYLKFDMAYGFDSGVFTKKPVYYLSLGYDF